MLVNYLIIGCVFTTVVSAKTIAVTAFNGTFSPHSIIADINDSVEIRALNTSDAFVPIQAAGFISPCLEAERKSIFFSHSSVSPNDNCTLRSSEATFTVLDKNPIIIFSAGLCLRGMVLDVNVDGAVQGIFKSALAVTTEESVQNSTALEGCLSNPFITPNSTSDPRIPPPVPAQVGLGAAIAILVIALVTAVIGIVAGGIAFYLQRKKRRAKFAHFKYAMVAEPFMVPQTETGMGGGPAMMQAAAEQEPLTSSNAEYGHNR